ncbi:MAG: ATP phosphoribosyltransferase regulatory subunit [Clostridia bacterium 41_269]|nr:MAG: ATP phosphoribosyltransferase regulatory subunit [Clostridia bacterium 41_269]
MVNNAELITPSGIRDWAPENSWRKRYIENILVGLFRSWGYEEIITGTLEFDKVISKGLTDEEKTQLYRFFGREGEILTLRPDMTTPIARFAASHLKNESLPLRFCYTANVFRYEKIQAGRYREFFQAGVELIGADSCFADAEIIILASRALQEVGVEDFRIGIGDTNLLNSILELCNLEEKIKTKLKKAVAEKDYVTINTIICKLKNEKYNPNYVLLEKLNNIYKPQKFADEFSDFENIPEIRKGLVVLRKVLSLLKDAGLEDRMLIDLGITRDFQYYTGIVFEIYSPHLGFPICGGGRYDNLLSNFGFNCPATGFAMGIERILLVLEASGKLPRSAEKRCIVAGRDFNKVFKKAEELRAQGFFAEVDLNNRDETQLKKYALKKGISYVEVVN